MDKAEVAFTRDDGEAFELAAATVEADVGCLEDLVWPVLAARVHGVRAMTFYRFEDFEAALRSLRAQVAVLPGSSLPASMPADHPLHTLLAEARSVDDPRDRIAASDLEMWIDGTKGHERPIERPAIVQWRQGEGTWTSGVFEPVAELGLPAPVDPEPVETKVRKPLKKAPVAFAAGAGVSAVSSAILFGMSRASVARYDDPDTPLDDVTRLRRAANGRFVGGQVMGGVALGLGGAAVFTGVF